MFRVLARLFTNQARARAAHSGAAPQAGRRSVELLLADFEVRAKTIRRRRSSRQIIDLAYAKALLGRDWERIAPRMGQLIAQILEQQLGLSDCCFARDGDRYHILFERTSERDAQAKAAKIAAIIARLLPGKPDRATERTAIHALTDGSAVRKSWLSRVLKRIGNVFHRRKSSASHRAQKATEDLSAESSHPVQAAASPTAAAGEARAAQSKHSAPAAKLAAIAAPAQPRRAAQPQALPNAPRPRSKAAMALRRSGAPREFPPPGLTFVYQPFWEVRGGRISTYISMPVCEGEDGILLGNQVLPLPAELRHVTQLDDLALKQAIKDVQKSQPTEGASVAIPVHFATLAEVARRSSYLMQCSELPDSLRSRFILEIMDLPEETPKTVVDAVIGELNPFVRGVTIQLPVYQWDLRRWTDAGVIAVGVNRARNSMKETEFVAQFNRFSTLAADAGLQSYLQNAETLSLSVAAVGAGATFVSGTIVADFDLTKRFKVQPYGLAQLYDQPGLLPPSDAPSEAVA